MKGEPTLITLQVRRTVLPTHLGSIAALTRGVISRSICSDMVYVVVVKNKNCNGMGSERVTNARHGSREGVTAYRDIANERLTCC